MRSEISRLTSLGPLPLESEASGEYLEQFEAFLSSVAPPISDNEARALVQLFGPDNCFGLAWSMLHLVETAPGWPLMDCLITPSNDWVATLRDRADLGGGS